MNPAQEILDYNENCANAYSSEPAGPRRHLLFEEEIEFMEKQSNSNVSTIITACQAQLSLGLDYFYTVQQQLMSTQQAWAAVIAEKERFNAFGWQARPTDFTRALHTCLFVIAKRSNMGLLGPFQGVNRIQACIEGQVDLPLNNGIITVGYDNGNDLPDYEDSPIQCTEFEQWADLETVSYVEDDEGYCESVEDDEGDYESVEDDEGDCESEEYEQNDGSQDAEEEESIYEPTSPTLNLDSQEVFNPWAALLHENGHTISAPKRPVSDDHEDPQGEMEGRGEAKKRRIM
ncbi:hypothetical protein B0H67DRAFT_675856 [Lasiosphaeris hirsuta]|uniref:Uncharacterized protein n=1 Tax=Lasiosphaeris hirsuta TaxID=260670 RepID=A0AA40DGW7_9PEZI|nr:hypothetical protein B0H67DRAFT_675856 [Lasiosphaeris hirsuta]